MRDGIVIKAMWLLMGVMIAAISCCNIGRSELR